MSSSSLAVGDGGFISRSCRLPTGCSWDGCACPCYSGSLESLRKGPTVPLVPPACGKIVEHRVLDARTLCAMLRNHRWRRRGVPVPSLEVAIEAVVRCCSGRTVRSGTIFGCFVVTQDSDQQWIQVFHWDRVRRIAYVTVVFPCALLRISCYAEKAKYRRVVGVQIASRRTFCR